ncbi:hypothetical protein GALMADRAFT_236113 [Galerina marginata CBS 339.88]|uniref:Uncharacterized protein n=1 Tax=Galerina marginata (strain CBS 339.88) TaxID=685588 RepID=A0A067TKR4_GALM3|nr:hypothetical protein GALMADRAFT_236113 [Galerina marginata CBS 339.88]
MAPGSFLFLLFSLFVCHRLPVRAQTISTTTPVPPLQWINLSNLLQGSARPPPLRDAAIGYDETSRSLIVFGGLSETGLPQSQTFLLNLQTLLWSTPSPPANLQRAPPSRSAALFGTDFAASNRHGFVVIGGQGSDGKALSDTWEYDFNNQFWSEVVLSPGAPSPRWGASGGIDIRTPPIQDAIVPGPNNTFYLAGGFNGNTVSPLSDVWRLNVSGTLSSNLPDSVQGSWEHLTINSLPGRVSQAGAVISHQVIATGGCDSNVSPTATNATCPKQDAFIIDALSQAAVTPSSCPAPRVAPVLVPNMNTFSTAFGSQVFLLLGSFNSSLWQDSNGLVRGEVAILDINTGSWTRILPSGDPDSSGVVRFPSPREGAAALSFSEALVGNSRPTSSDTIIFGGQDTNGSFLSDVWLLRAYTGAITPSSPTWSGFGDGQLQTGVNADGSGVRVTYLTECASLIAQQGSNSSSPSTANNGSDSGSGQSGASQTERLFNTSFVHKLSAPLSVVVLLPVFLFFRWTQASLEERWLPNRNVALVVVFTIFGLAAYGLGIVGLIFSFTTISSMPSSHQDTHLKTSHGVVGLIFFLCLYVLVPLLYLVFACFSPRSDVYGGKQSQRSISPHGNSFITNEKADPGPPAPRSLTPSVHNTSPPSSPRPRTLSWDASNMLRPSHDEGMSGESTPSATIGKGFEVVNRPNRANRHSGSWPAPSAPGAAPPLPSTRSLGDIDWLLRRRSLNAVGELDYAITQAHNAQHALNASHANTSPAVYVPMIKYPRRQVVLLHVLVQLSVLGLAIVSLVQLWMRAKRYLFVIFFVWIAAYYTIMVTLAWYRRPASSLLTVALWHLRGKTLPIPLQGPSNPSTASPGPYTHHRPPFRTATQPDELSYSHASPANADTDDTDEDIDEDTRQRLIEEEMDRREVSIVTVPRRKLLVTNPS